LIFKIISQRSRSLGQIFTVQHPCENSRINILQWIFTKVRTYIVLRRVWNSDDFQGQRSRGKKLTPRLFTLKINRVPDSPKDYVCTKIDENPLKDVDSRVFTIVHRRVWNPVEFQGQRSRGQISTTQHPCEHSRINMLQWIFTKVGTYIVLRRVWNKIH
jgi:hypothetical protein